MKLLAGCFLLLFLEQSLADIYLHYPRGSNNRLNERSAQRRNGNRAFDSQNNNRGGYNVGDKSDKPFANEDGQFNENAFVFLAQRIARTRTMEKPIGSIVSSEIVQRIYSPHTEKNAVWVLVFFMSSAKSMTSKTQGNSLLNIEWTNQHGCGGNEDTDPHKVNCNLVIQYLCQPDKGFSKGHKMKLRNGKNTNTPTFQGGSKTEKVSQTIARMNSNLNTDTVLQEQWSWYEKCNVRNRNKGLFTADQNLRGNSAKYTRQNPNGNRRGYECPEERDYYPYWHPSEWKDIAVLAENASRCSFYRSESFNVNPRHECIGKDSDGKYKIATEYNNKKDCEDNSGEWMEFYNYLEKAPQYKTKPACTAASGNGIRYIWGRTLYNTNEECLVALEAPECQESTWSRDNHLGNGVDGQPLRYTWKLPYFPSGDSQRCVLRLRYNISTDDYDPVKTDSKSNLNRLTGVLSPVENNPQVDVGVSNTPLRLAMNTAQYGRTFQDRTHLFLLQKRPSPSLDSKTIHNLGVRGKRGNIVQVYPAVEYDFFPTNLTMKSDDLVHIQWAGSNTHNNGNPGGDGQTGDAGEGTGGTDRNNILEVKDLNNNYPVPFKDSKLFKGAKVHWSSLGDAAFVKKLSGEDVAVTFGSSGYYRCMKSSTCGPNSVESKAAMNNLLNNTPASFGGMLVEFAKGLYRYICSRNNNFTNRSQKGTIEVK